ncbi:6460_t:CDS:1 [Dentiscutata erythropus]|uniref:6460_t:CDS:1 n=1 Tax=Dentiscutata erythropus TaxID=1348616 RepID=A0A9N9G1G4_9GLOM|nr:6460_t:CDS:1 [Dentiscutata erythropus]
MNYRYQDPTMYYASYLYPAASPSSKYTTSYLYNPSSAYKFEISISEYGYANLIISIIYSWLLILSYVTILILVCISKFVKDMVQQGMEEMESSANVVHEGPA